MIRMGVYALLVTACTSGVFAQGRDRVARSDMGMVVAAHPLAALAGLRILEQGGNAADAVRATSKEWAALQAERIVLADRGGSTDQGAYPAFDRYAIHESLTTYLSVADSAGMVVSLTQTLGPAMGSAVGTPGLGFLYVVTLGGYGTRALQVGERSRFSITPFLVLHDGEPFLVLGSAGDVHIISSIVQATSHVIDDGMSFPETLAAPRVHPNFDSTYAFSGTEMETSRSNEWSEQQLDAEGAAFGPGH